MSQDDREAYFDPTEEFPSKEDMQQMNPDTPIQAFKDDEVEFTFDMSEGLPNGDRNHYSFKFVISKDQHDELLKAASVLMLDRNGYELNLGEVFRGLIESNLSDHCHRIQTYKDD